MRRHLPALSTRGAIATVAVAVALAVSTAGIAAASYTVGDPQPELAQFHVGATGGTGTGAVLSDGTLVLASPSANDESINVCGLHPGNRACAWTAVLRAYAGGASPDTFSGIVEVVWTGGTDVSIVSEDCCYLQVGGFDGGAVVFDSTNDGRTFTAEIPAGTISSVGAATYADGQIVVGDQEISGFTQLQAFAPDPGSPTSAIALVGLANSYDTSLTTYNNGVLVASDNLNYSTVYFAHEASDFSSTGSYALVASFPGLVTGISGSALLTDPSSSLTGGELIRFFNGASFGGEIHVPDYHLGDDGYFSLQEVGRTAHVFFEGRRDSYDLLSETTTSAGHWSHQTQYATAIDAENLAPVLGPTGAGLVFENDGTPLLAQPILNAQSVHITFAIARVKVGHTAVLRGSVGPHLAGQVVTLERDASGKWHPMKTTHESASGAFAFSFATPAHSEAVRAVVRDKPGYYEYGYSNAATLVALE